MSNKKDPAAISHNETTGHGAGAFSDEVDTGLSKKMRPNQKARAFSDEVDAGSSQKMRPNQKARAFSDEVDAGSSNKMRPNKKLERRSDSIGSECALVERTRQNGATTTPHG